MASPRPAAPRRKRSLPRSSAKQSGGGGIGSVLFSLLALGAGAFLVYAVLRFHANYAVSFQAPLTLHVQWPVVIAHRADPTDVSMVQFDQQHPLTAYQQYACRKFGAACRTALAIQRAENPQGKCEIYHYNADGTLDWGYFQINTVHLQRRGLVLRDLLDCRANIDFAAQLYREQNGFNAWSTFKNGSYKKFLPSLK